MRYPGPMLGLALALVAGPPPSLEAPKGHDVVVYAATAGGVIAAVAAGREGKRVVLVEPGQHVGGMVSGGLGATDAGNRGAIGGYSREFFRLVREEYARKYGPDSPQVKDCSDGFHFEPHVAETIFRRMLAEAKVEVVFGSPLARVEKDARRIVSITTTPGASYLAPVFIDASYEGDLMAAAGVAFATGREDRSDYRETLAGCQEFSPAHQWPVAVPAFGPDELLLPGIQPGDNGRAGVGDNLTQAYNYRICMTDRPENRVPFPKPADYDPKRYELLARYLALKPGLKFGQLMNPVRMPNGKTDTNNNGPFSTDHIGGNQLYPGSPTDLREAIRLDHVSYVQGFLYFLAKDPRVPGPLRDEMARWGLAKDEFVDTGHWPHQLYVRECRRMLGAFVMTQADILEDREKPDSVGLGSYTADSHHVKRVALADGSTRNEGDFQVRVRPYAIPYRSLVPRPAECSNLLVPVGLSASHVAYGSIRMEPVYMILGQASGVAACLAIDGKLAVQDVDPAKLREALKGQGAILSPGEVPVAGIDPAGLPGIVVDDSRAVKAGEWAHSSALGPFVGEGYLHDGGKGDGSARARFTPTIAEAGRHEVRLYSTPNPNRATNATVVIHSAEGERTVRVDQRRATTGGGPISVGVFAFARGESGWVEIRDDGADGHVIADAVQFVPRP